VPARLSQSRGDPLKAATSILLRAVFSSAILASGISGMAQGVYTSIVFPGATSTVAYGINDAGTIVGQYIDASGNGHGFVVSGKTYTTIDYPGATDSSAQAINDQGQIVGSSFSGSNFFGWICDTRTGEFQQVSYPGATDSVPLAINNSGTVAGDYQILQGNNTSNYGFEEVGSQYTSISAPGAQGTAITGVSSDGVLVGYAGGVIYEDFSLYDGIFRPLRVSRTQAFVNGINPNATSVAGQYFLDEHTAGFVYAKNNFQTLLFPNAKSTFAFGVNASGVVVGYFVSKEGTEGFVWTPPAE